LKAYNEKQSIADYVWNGFHAHASQVIIDFKDNALGNLVSLSITDNGYGRNKPKLKVIYLIKAQHRTCRGFLPGMEYHTFICIG